MKVIEILNLNKEYQSLYNKGEKTTYIVSVLADKYDISERTVYDIIRRFKSDCNLLAV